MAMNDTSAQSGREQAADIRVVIADDHAVVREGLRALVNAHAGLRVVGVAADGDEAIRRARELEPDVLVLDLSMPGTNGAEVADRVAHECPRVRVLVLTMHEERGYVTRMLRAGAAGYVLKATASAELVRAIETVAKGGTYVDPSLAGTLLAGSPTRPERRVSPTSTTSLADLTPRETDVLRLVALGHSNKEIAAALGISVKTVETHKANGMAKLGLANRAALVRFAIGVGWLQNE
jgi:DNA-binding NarL/FixJ family response regulator